MNRFLYKYNIIEFSKYNSIDEQRIIYLITVKTNLFRKIPEFSQQPICHKKGMIYRF